MHLAHRPGFWSFRPGHPALRGVSLEVAVGERVGIIGPSGSGKTTLARCAVGLLTPDQGEVRLFGGPVRSHRAKAQLLFQDPRAMLHPDLPIALLLEESARLHRPKDDADAAVREVLTATSLDHRRDALPSELSGGERRRAGIARVLMARPALLVADEPTSGLDAVLKHRILDLLVQSAGPACAVVLVSHDLQAIAPHCERVVVVERGLVIETFATAALATGYAAQTPCTAALLQASGWNTTHAVGGV